MPENTILMIPARMASTRLPGKPLADIAGLPMIVQVVRRAEESGLGRAIVATDSKEVADVVEKHGGEAVMTRDDHESGSDRIWDALEKIDPRGNVETIVNVQGDLPTIDRESIRASVAPLADVFLIFSGCLQRSELLFFSILPPTQELWQCGGAS